MKNLFLFVGCLLVSVLWLNVYGLRKNDDESPKEMTKEEISAAYKTVASEAYKNWASTRILPRRLPISPKSPQCR